MPHKVRERQVVKKEEEEEHRIGREHITRDDPGRVKLWFSYLHLR